MRAHALLGDWDASFAEAERLVQPASAVGYWTLRARLAIWRGRVAEAEDHLRRVDLPSGAPTSAPAMLLSALTERRVPAGATDLDATPALRRGGVRRRCFHLQILAEITAHLGDRAATLDVLRRASDAASSISAWIDRCPLFEPLREDARFWPIHAEVRRRAGEILAAYRAPFTS